MDNLNTKVIISWVLLSTMLFVISNSLETEDQFENIDRHADSQGKREIIKITIPRRHKRSVDSSINFPLRAFGRDINLNLRQTAGILFSSKTPVYFLRTGQSQTLIETKYNMFSSNLLSKLYVDEEKQAAFTLTTDPTDGSTKIKYGFIGSENLIIDQLNPNASIDGDSVITYNQDHYMATSIANIISHAVTDFLGVGVNRRNPAKAATRIPETIYPEVLILVDYALYKNFNEQGIIPYLIQFWNGVDLYYRPLQNPRYKLSVAGVAIAQDQNVWRVLSPSSSWGGQSLIRYNSVISQMGPWLRNAGKSIPLNSYDTHIVMTPHRDGVEVQTGVVGLAYVSSACTNVNGYVPQGGTVHETGNLHGILTAVHELGHVFGANHDESGPCSTRSIMAPIESPSNEIWSQCSINDFHSNLRDRDFSCMYNQPAFDNGAGNGNNNPPTINTPIPHDPNNNDNQAPTVFHVEITDDRDQLTVGLKDFAQNRKIKIYYEHNKLVITQRNTDYLSTSTGYKQDLQIRVADNMMITLDPSEINPSKLIYIYHDNGYIYVYQGNKPGSDKNDVPQPPDNDNSGGSDHWPWGYQYAFCFGRSYFQLNKLVSINFRNNKLYVSQRNAPNNQYENSPPPPSDLEYTGSDTKAIYIVPSSIKPNTELCAWQANGLIYVRTRNKNSAY